MQENTSVRYWIRNFLKNLLLPLSIILIASIINRNILLPIPEKYAYLSNKFTSIAIIAAITWILVNLINLAEKLFTLRYRVDQIENLLVQKTYTQIIILKRIVIGVVLTLAFGAILMLFDNVRELGTSLLASAGIAGLVAGLAAQGFLKNLITSLQIAINQPLKINDYVVVENEFGQIEEITLNYIVLRIWDLRRLIIPINYFVDKPFQNLSRKSTNIIGTVFLYVDYTLPVEELRQEAQRIAQASPLWDKKLCVLHVSDAKERTMELRILVTAKNPGDAWDLRCEVREKLIAYIREKFPQSLPHARVEIPTIKTETLTPQAIPDF